LLRAGATPYKPGMKVGLFLPLAGPATGTRDYHEVETLGHELIPVATALPPR
jgi:hypothetical protein